MANPVEISLINLDRNPERLAQFHRVNAHLTQVERVPAMDGARYSRTMLVENKILAESMRGYTDGAVGCALSHLARWELACSEKKVLTVAEDDAVFHRDFEPLATRLLANLPADWDIILWGWNFDSILLFDLIPAISSCLARFDQQKLRSSLAAYQESTISPVTYRLKRAFGLVCYSISPSGAERLYRHCIPIRPMETYFPGLDQWIPNVGIDCMLNEVYASINSFVCFPPVVVTENDHATSTTVADPSGFAVRHQRIVPA
jgi:glycosyl transferase family 25